MENARCCKKKYCILRAIGERGRVRGRGRGREEKEERREKREVVVPLDTT